MGIFGDFSRLNPFAYGACFYPILLIALYPALTFLSNEHWLSCGWEDKDLVGIMTHETVLAVLPHSEDEAKSLKDIAQLIGLAIYTHTDWTRAERSLARVLRILIKWGWAYRGRRQSDNIHRFWYNVYWKTDWQSNTRLQVKNKFLDPETAPVKQRIF